LQCYNGFHPPAVQGSPPGAFYVVCQGGQAVAAYAGVAPHAPALYGPLPWCGSPVGRVLAEPLHAVRGGAAPAFGHGM
jgi:hypothetical protein